MLTQRPPLRGGLIGLRLVHVEIPQPGRLAVLGLDFAHSGMGRPPVKPVQQTVKVGLLALCNHFDLPIGEVFGVALKLEVAGIPLYKTAVAHALNGSGNKGGKAHIRRMVAGAGQEQVSVRFRCGPDTPPCLMVR